MCPKYIFWYKKEITADNIKKAIRVEDKTKLKFHSVKEEDEPEVSSGVNCIGFESYEDNSDDF